MLTVVAILLQRPYNATESGDTGPNTKPLVVCANLRMVRHRRLVECGPLIVPIELQPASDNIKSSRDQWV